MSVPTEKKAMAPEEKKANTDRNRAVKLIREQLSKAEQLINHLSGKKSQTPQEEKILGNAPTALAKSKKEFANLVTSNKASWDKLVRGSWEDLVEPAYKDLKGDFQSHLETYPEKELYEAPELSSNSSASSAPLAEKPDEAPLESSSAPLVEDPVEVLWSEVKLRGLIRC